MMQKGVALKKTAGGLKMRASLEAPTGVNYE